MFETIKNWHLFTLVGIVSVLSLILVQQYVFAQWQDPTTDPGSTSATSLVINPIAENIDLNDYTIYDDDFIIEPGGTYGIKVSGTPWAGYFEGDVKIVGDLDITGTSTISSLWSENGSDIYYNSGDVGIGTNSPNKLLHVYSSTTNAEIDIQSGSSNTHWGIYQDETTTDLRFWNEENRVTFTDEGKVGIGTISPTNMLHVTAGSGNAVYGEASAAGGSGFYGAGFFGLYAKANQANGIGVFGVRESGAYAGYFQGTLRITDGYNPSSTGYLHLNVIDGDPPLSDCNSTDHRGRMIYNYTDDQLFICDYDPVDPPSSWKAEDIPVVDLPQ